MPAEIREKERKLKQQTKILCFFSCLNLLFKLNCVKFVKTWMILQSSLLKYLFVLIVKVGLVESWYQYSHV